MAFVHYRPETPEGREAQLQAIAIVTAGLDSPELLQQELRAALGAKPDAKSWTLLTIALGQVGMKMAALAATLDAAERGSRLGRQGAGHAFQSSPELGAIDHRGRRPERTRRGGAPL